MSDQRYKENIQLFQLCHYFVLLYPPFTGPLSSEEEAKALDKQQVQVNNKVAQSKTKKALDDFYRPNNQKLAELLKSDIYLYP